MLSAPRGVLDSPPVRRSTLPASRSRVSQHGALGVWRLQLRE